MNATRRPLKFESSDGSVSYSWQRYNLEYDNAQPLLAPSIPLTGAHYEYDQLEGAPAIKGIGRHTIRFLMVGTPAALEAELDEMKAKLYLIGQGKFYLEDSDGAQRWCWARMTAMPDIRLGVTNRETIPVIIDWAQRSDFYDADAIDDHEGNEFTVASDPDTVEVTNPGSVPVYNAIITVKGTFSGLQITNDDTGYVLASTTEGTGSSDWLRFDAGLNAVQVSNDGGASWSDDSVNFLRAPGQVALMVMQPGANSLTFIGANGADVVVEMSGAHH